MPQGRVCDVCTAKSGGPRRFICYTLDAAVEANDSSRNPAGRTCALFDLRNLGLDCLDNSVLKSCFELLQVSLCTQCLLLYVKPISLQQGNC